MKFQRDFFFRVKSKKQSVTHLQALRILEKARGLLTWYCLLNYAEKEKTGSSVCGWEMETLLLLMTHDRVRVQPLVGETEHLFENWVDTRR